MSKIISGNVVAYCRCCCYKSFLICPSLKFGNQYDGCYHLCKLVFLLMEYIKITAINLYRIVDLIEEIK